MISEKIYTLRQKKGVSQETMALDLNISRQAVSKWETGQSTPDLDKIILLSKYFNVSIDYLVDNNNFNVPISNEPSYNNQDDINFNRLSEMNNLKRLSKLFIKTYIAITILYNVITYLMIVFQKQILYPKFALNISEFIFPYVKLIFLTISSLTSILIGIFVIKKMNTNTKSITSEIIYLLIISIGFYLWNELYTLCASFYLKTFHSSLAPLAARFENLLNSFVSIDILLIIGILIELIVRKIDSSVSTFYPKKEYRTRDSVFSFLIGLFLGIPGLLFEIIWLKDAKTDNQFRYKKMRFWYIISFSISIIISLLILLIFYLDDFIFIIHTF